MYVYVAAVHVLQPYYLTCRCCTSKKIHCPWSNYKNIPGLGLYKSGGVGETWVQWQWCPLGGSTSRNWSKVVVTAAFTWFGHFWFWSNYVNLTDSDEGKISRRWTSEETGYDQCWLGEERRSWSYWRKPKRRERRAPTKPRMSASHMKTIFISLKTTRLYNVQSKECNSIIGADRWLVNWSLVCQSLIRTVYYFQWNNDRLQ